MGRVVEGERGSRGRFDEPMAPELLLAKAFDRIPAKGEGGAGGGKE